MRFAIAHASSPVGGLLFVKLAAIGLGVYCWRRGRERLLTRMNIMFAVLIAWNLAALIVGSVHIS